MAQPAEKLAQALEALKTAQEGGKIAIRTGNLTRPQRERLVKNGFLQEVMKGWYVPSRPDETAGESTAWYASFWGFCAQYLESRFGADWSLSPDQSLNLHAGNRTVPRQLLVRSPKAKNNVTGLPHETSVMDVKGEIPKGADAQEIEGLRGYSLPAALIACSPNYFVQNPTDARAVLTTFSDASDLLRLLLGGGHSTVAGRLAGAFRNIGRDRIADDILQTMKSADFDVREADPFETQIPVFVGHRETSPIVSRIRLMWQAMREPVLELFPAPPGLPGDAKTYLKGVDDNYVTDAYHSLSIEGYRVSHDLIERVRSGNWNPENDAEDRAHTDALAARGYWLAFQAVRKSLERILKGENAGDVADDGHREWYREMFAPSVIAGILRPADLAGYRNAQVYIRRSMHVPPHDVAVRDAMPTFFDLIRKEQEPAVRIVLGHFIFVYIHPYMDGNGRTGRFLMNTMMASGGYPWTVIPVEERAAYMSALEEASVNQNIRPFASFLAKQVTKAMA
ncbi:MAG: Fic family protein, partial [Rhodospirillales bacterium]|nr:Fic family protein [Rhodospirillales bacterium]